MEVESDIGSLINYAIHQLHAAMKEKESRTGLRYNPVRLFKL